MNDGLIDLWNEIKDNPQRIADTYREHWKNLNKDDDKARKRKYFEDVRAEYNKNHSPYDFMFIMRTTTNGMPRYNGNGDFNNSFHITRNGILPNKLKKIAFEWSDLLNKKNVQFICQDFSEVKPSKKDFLYLDPPYANTKGMYYGKIDYVKLWSWLRGLPCKYLLSFDGISGDVDNTQVIPDDVYSEHIYLKSGNSSFKRTIGKSRNSMVYESLYIS